MSVRTVFRPDPRLTERGSIMALAAVMVVVLSIFGGLAWGAGMLDGANQEGRRATDLAAVAGAANLPTVVIGPTTTNPVDVAGQLVTIPDTGLPKASDLAALACASVPAPPSTPTSVPSVPAPSASDTICPLPQPTDISGNLPGFASDWRGEVCEVARAQFKEGGGSSLITDNWGHIDWTKHADPTQDDCRVSTSLANPWLGSVARCVQTQDPANNCLNALQTDIKNNLAVAKGTPLETAYDTAIGQAGGKGTLVTDTVMAQLNAANNGLPIPGIPGSPVDLTLKGQLTPLINLINTIKAQSAPLPALTPTMFNPYVTVELTQHMTPPGAGLVGNPNLDVTNRATARRRIKNAVLVPAVSLDPACNLAAATPACSLTINPPIDKVSVPPVIPPGTLPIQPPGSLPVCGASVANQLNLNPSLACLQNPLLDALTGFDKQLGQVMDDSLKTHVCPTFSSTVCDPSNPPKPSEPMYDAMTDTREVDNPPPGYPAPSPNQYIADNACVNPQTLAVDSTCASTQHPVLVAASSVVTDPSKVLSTSAWNNPLVQQIVPGLLFAPADMMIPATLQYVPGTKQLVATPIPYVNQLATAAGESKGLYRARLVDK